MKVKLLVAAVVAALVGRAPVPASDVASIYDTLERRDELAVLFVAVTEAREAATLRSAGPYTLFAPSDSAFKNLGDAAVKKLATDKEAVRALLRAHLVRGKYTTKELSDPDLKELKNLRDRALKVEPKDGLRVGGAKVVTPDVQCSNGVIHVIDAVLPYE